MIHTINDFIREYKIITGMGWIKTHRSGSTGIGKTIEDLLGIQENNLGEPDFGDYELKSSRTSSNSMLTIFTKSPQPAKSNTYLRLKYGYTSINYNNIEKVLHSTLCASRFTTITNTEFSLRINCSIDRISIESNLGIEPIFWEREALRATFNKKYKNKFIHVRANSRGTGIDEEFQYLEAYEVSGFDYDSFVKLLEDGKIYIDLRIGQYPNGKTHDHGTAFRIREQDQYLLFKNRRKIV